MIEEHTWLGHICSLSTFYSRLLLARGDDDLGKVTLTSMQLLSEATSRLRIAGKEPDCLVLHVLGFSPDDARPSLVEGTPRFVRDLAVAMITHLRSNCGAMRIRLRRRV